MSQELAVRAKRGRSSAQFKGSYRKFVTVTEVDEVGQCMTKCDTGSVGYGRV